MSSFQLVTKQARWSVTSKTSRLLARCMQKDHPGLLKLTMERNPGDKLNALKWCQTMFIYHIHCELTEMRQQLWMTPRLKMNKAKGKEHPLWHEMLEFKARMWHVDNGLLY